MAKFCGNCGAQMDDADKVCGQCGTPFAGAAISDSTPAVKEKGNNKVVKLIVGVIVAIVAIVVIANIVGNYSGYKGTINKMVKALQNYDTATLESVASSIIEETVVAWYGDDYDVYDYYDEAISDTLDKYEDSVGTIKKISYEITDETELSDRRLNELKDNLEDSYNMDTSDIKKVVQVDLKINVKGSKKSSTYNVNNIYMIKENSDWKVFYGNLNY